MKITKFVHSCLLVQENNINILLDPGEYTYKEKALDIHSLPKLDYLLITHEHSDHMCIPIIKEIVSKFPDVQIISNSSVKNILEKEGLTVSTEENDVIKIKEVPHEKALTNPPPKNVLFTVFDKLVDPGDCLSYNVETEILAMPIVGSWGSTIQCLDQAVKIKPKVVIPIHDWHWNTEARKWYYDRAKIYLEKYGIEFRSLETGEAIEV